MLGLPLAVVWGFTYVNTDMHLVLMHLCASRIALKKLTFYTFCTPDHLQAEKDGGRGLNIEYIT